MNITVNDEVVETRATDVEKLVEERLGKVPQSGTAVAVDARVVARSAWASTQLHEGAVVDILTAVQGG